MTQASNLHHRALFYAPQNREDSRSSDYESRFVSRHSWFFRKQQIKIREASRSMAQINEWKLVSVSDWWKEYFFTHYSTSVFCLNRKLDSFVKCLFSTHSASSPPFDLTNCRCDSSGSLSFDEQMGLGSLLELLLFFWSSKFCSSLSLPSRLEPPEMEEN